MFKYMRRERSFYRGIIMLALPLVLQNIIMSSLALVDTLLVGTLGEAAMAGMTVARTPLFVMDLLVFGLQSGSVVLISQFWGKKDERSINRVIGIGFYAAGALTALFTLVTILIPNQAMSLFTNDDNLAGIAASYIKYMGAAYFFHSLTAIYTVAHRGMENPKLGVFIYSCSMVLDTFLSWVLIFGKFGMPAMGVAGGAVGTLIACVLEFIAMLIYASFNKRFRLVPSLVFKPGKLMVRKYIKYSSPVVLNETLWGAGTALFPTIMGHMHNSQEILAAYTISGSIIDICTIGVFALAATSATIVGREIGEGNADTVYETGASLTTIAAVIGLVLGIAMLILLHTVVIPVIYPLFHLSQQGASTATMMLTVFAILFVLRSFNATNIVGVLRGGGDVHAATLIDVLPLWCAAVPVAAAFGLVFKFDILWVYLATGLDTVIKFAFGISRFRSKKWIKDVTKGIKDQ